jgi:hypothetical protein
MRLEIAEPDGDLLDAPAKTSGKRMTPIASLNVSHATVPESFWVEDETSVLHETDIDDSPNI